MSILQSSASTFSVRQFELMVACFSQWVSASSGFPSSSVVKKKKKKKNPPTNAGDTGSILGLGKNPWRRKWQPTPVFLPGESHGQRSLAGYSPWDHKESDTTERLSMHAIYIKAQMVPEAANGALKTASESFGHTLLML